MASTRCAPVATSTSRQPPSSGRMRRAVEASSGSSPASGSSCFGRSEREPARSGCRRRRRQHSAMVRGEEGRWARSSDLRGRARAPRPAAPRVRRHHGSAARRALARGRRRLRWATPSRRPRWPARAAPATGPAPAGAADRRASAGARRPRRADEREQHRRHHHPELQVAKAGQRAHEAVDERGQRHGEGHLHGAVRAHAEPEEHRQCRAHARGPGCGGQCVRDDRQQGHRHRRGLAAAAWRQGGAGQRDRGDRQPRCQPPPASRQAVVMGTQRQREPEGDCGRQRCPRRQRRGQAPKRPGRATAARRVGERGSKASLHQQQQRTRMPPCTAACTGAARVSPATARRWPHDRPREPAALRSRRRPARRRTARRPASPPEASAKDADPGTREPAQRGCQALAAVTYRADSGASPSRRAPRGEDGGPFTESSSLTAAPARCFRRRPRRLRGAWASAAVPWLPLRGAPSSASAAARPPRSGCAAAKMRA